MLPEAFLRRMENMLGEDYPRFLSEISKDSPVRALRVNRLKITPEAFLENPPFPLKPIPFLKEGFTFEDDKPGRTPAHHGGLFYVQDPSAMATVAASEITPGMKVLDMSAAPGGKSTQLASALGGEGILVSNEINPSRCKILVGNLERCGVRNAVCLNGDPEQLREWFSHIFDFVLLDAPCSGEGMLRKYEVAGEEWSEENVRMCAKRQADILEKAASCVASGGKLLYSTCTFSEEENEDNIRVFLTRHPEFSPVPVSDALLPYTAPGIKKPNDSFPIEYCRRFYPHISPGEGQFMALLVRDNDGVSPAFGYKDACRKPTRAESDAVWQFIKMNTTINSNEFTLRALNDKLFLFPKGNDGFPLPPKSVFLSGVLVGELRGNLLIPHHQFFSAYGAYFRRRIPLSPDSDEMRLYLHGEEFSTDMENGYAVVLVSGAPLGGVKVSAGKAKNHYPKGLRTK